MNIPETLPTLAAGDHEEGARQVCAMEAAAWLANEKHSDRPSCVHPAIAAVARNVNDSVDEATRQTLWPLILRSMGTASNDQVLRVRLAVWCAKEVLGLYESKNKGDDRPRKAIEAASAWADCPCVKHAAAANAAYKAAAAAASVNANAAANAAYAAAAVAAAANAAYKAAAANAAYKANAAYAAAAVAAAANAAYNAAAANAADNAVNAADAADKIGIWTGLLDEYDRLTGRGNESSVNDQDWSRLMEFASSIGKESD